MIDPVVDFKIESFGCKVNTYDSGLLEKRFALAGFHPDLKKPKVHVLNTCAVTAEATRAALKRVRQIKAKDPFCTVVVTGCAAQVDTDRFEGLKAADLIVANSHKGKLEEIIVDFIKGKTDQRIYKSNIFKKWDLEAGGGLESSHTRSFLKIQDGCNSFCTFCVIPFARGKSRSLPQRELIRRINDLHENGILEVVLTGVHIGDYCDEESNNLEDLVENILLQTKIPRIRLTSLEPIELSDRLLELFAHEKMCPHFHMSMQSANSQVLANMKRKYGQVEVRKSLESIFKKLPHAFVGMDVIVGFPAESDDEFNDTYNCFQQSPWTRIHVFPYSLRPGTFAHKIEPKLPRHVIQQRSQILRELSWQRYSETALQQVGQTKQVLLLNNDSNKGIARDYWPIQVLNNSENFKKVGEVGVKITGFDYSDRNQLQPPLQGQIC